MIMIRARILYIWEGPETFCFTRGHSFDGDKLKSTKIKHKGLFNRFINVFNIEEFLIGTPKKIIVKDKILSGWQAIKINMCIKTHTQNIPDLPPHLISLVKTLRNEVDMWKSKYYEERKKNLDREQRDKFKERVRDEFDFMGKVRQKLYPQEYGMGFGFGYPRYGYGLGYTQRPEEEVR